MNADTTKGRAYIARTSGMFPVITDNSIREKGMPTPAIIYKSRLPRAVFFRIIRKIRAIKHNV
jgi:hypothetical protein